MDDHYNYSLSPDFSHLSFLSSQIKLQLLWSNIWYSPGGTMERGGRGGFTEAVFEDGAPPRGFLRHGSNRVAAVIFGATLEPCPRGTQADFRSGRLGGCGRIGMSQRCEAELNDLLGALADLTLNTQSPHQVTAAVAPPLGSDADLSPGSRGLGWAGRR